MASLYENLRLLLTVTDELRDVGLNKMISLPRIVAIGTQSSGKSSVIESVVGRDFLPRGGGVVTRRPLELRLVHLSSQEYKNNEAWGIFDKVSDRKYTDFDLIRQEIERQTDEIAGANKGIVNEPIVLTIYATDAPDLTLVDLPGITRVPVKGSDQSEDIEKLTRDMTLHYIQDPRTVILAVLPANQDMSVSDALQLARQVDPNGIRSIGVITKIDIMDQGTDACKMIRGDEISLKHGYVGVRMRSQQDITTSKPIKDALDEEKKWFEAHHVYNKLPPGMLGIPVLIDKLSKILFKSIRRYLPEIKKEVSEKQRSLQDRLEELGEGVPIEEGEKVQVMWTMVTDYCELFKNTIRGKYDKKLQRYMVNLKKDGNQGGGAKVRGIMNDFLIEYLDVNITAEMSDDDFDHAMRTFEGDSLPGFPSPDTFEFLALPHLQKIAIPAVECVHNVSSALDVLAQRIGHAVFRRFPKMAEAAIGLTQNIIQRERDTTRITVEQQVACSTGYLFTNDPEYLINHGAMEPMFQSQGKNQQQQQEEEKRDPTATEKALQNAKDTSAAVFQGAKQVFKRNEQHRKQQRYSGMYVQEIRKRLDCYFAITVRNIRDSVPKAIGFYLVRMVQDKLQFELLNALNQKERLAELLGEPPHIMEERRTLMAQLAVLQKASAVLTRDPTLAAIALEAEDEEVVSAPARPKAPGAGGMLSRVAGAAAQMTGNPAPAPGGIPAAGGGTASTFAPPVRSAPASTGGLFSSSKPAGSSNIFDDDAPSARPSAGLPVSKPATGGGGLFDDEPGEKRGGKPTPTNPLASLGGRT